MAKDDALPPQSSLMSLVGDVVCQITVAVQCTHQEWHQEAQLHSSTTLIIKDDFKNGLGIVFHVCNPS